MSDPPSAADGPEEGPGHVADSPETTTHQGVAEHTETSTEPTSRIFGWASVNAWRARRQARRRLQSRLRRRLTRSFEALTLVALALVASVAGYFFYQLNSIARIPVKVTPVSSSGIEDILLLGSTSRCAVTPSKNFENFVQQCRSNINGVNSDVIMVLRLVPHQTPKLLSIPRDTFVPDARSGGLYNKIDAALADGPSQLVQAIQQDFGIPINHFVVLNFETFANIVTALGGITMYFPTSLKDQQSGLYISHSGCLHISGLEALALVRARHLQYHYDKKIHQWLGYDGSGDIGRIERVHIFMKVLGEEVAKRGLSNLATDNALVSTIAPDLTIDSSFGNKEIIDLLLGYHAQIAATVESTLPIVEDTQTYYYKGYNYGDVVFPSQPQDRNTIDTFLGGTAPGANVRPSQVSVSVVNGTNAPTAGTALSSKLRRLGFRTTSLTSQTPVGSVVETTVEYSKAANLAKAERVLRSLAGLAVLAKTKTVGNADVTVVVGTNVTTHARHQAVIRPSATNFQAAILDAMLLAAGSSTLPLASSTTLTSPTTSSPAIAPYDPRACPSR